MQAQDDLSGVKCYICRQFGHRKADCPKYDPNYKKTRKEGSSKWCSLHKTTSHSDDECRAKGKKHHTKQQNKQGGGGAKWCSVHLTTSHADDECQLQNKQANNGNANFAKNFQQHHQTAPGE